MPPKRDTAHLHRANGRTACGRVRGLFTPNVLHAVPFGLAISGGRVKVCKYCLKAFQKLQGMKNTRPQ